MHALVRFAQIPPANTFSTGEVYPHVIAALSGTAEHYGLASLRYDLSKLRAKGLVEKLPRSRRYRLLAKGYSVCLIFLKLFERVYAPLTAALLHPIPADRALPTASARRSTDCTSALPTPSTISCEPSALHSHHPSTRTKSSLMPP
jgi:hypothetical protein